VIEDTWDPRQEPMAAARKRLLLEAERQLEAELERIAIDAVGRGYAFPDRDDAGRDLVWLFWKARDRLSYGQIAQRSRLEHPNWLQKGRKGRDDADPRQDTEPVNSAGDDSDPQQDRQLVKKAVLRMAARLGIDRTGW
jgi:hypothetical protein